MITSRKRHTLTRGLTLVAAVMLLGTASVFAQGNITGDPGPLILELDSTPVLGSEFTIDISIDLTGLTGTNCNSLNADAVLGGYSVRVNYDPSDVSFVSRSGGTAPQYGGNPTLGTSSGQVNLVADNGGSPTMPTGIVHFASVTFDAIAAGSTSISVTAVSMSSAVQCSGAPSGQFGGPESFSASPDTANFTIVNELPLPERPNLISPENGATGIVSPVTFVWEAAAGADSYIVALAKAGEPFETIGGTSGTSFTYVEPLEPGTTYRWRVRALNENGGVDSATREFTTAGDPECFAPLAPVLTGPAVAGDGEPFTIMWDSVDGATEYRVEESQTSTFDVIAISTVAGDINQLTITKSVDEDSTFYYRVRANNFREDCEEVSPFSAVVAVLVEADVMRMGNIPVVGETEGAEESNWNTEGQFHNPWPTTISGTMHLYSQALTASQDATINYIIDPGETLTFPNLMAAFGLTGLGSVDIISDEDDRLPIGVIRIYDDAGEDGTSGMTEPIVPEADLFEAGDTGVLIAPPDLERYRFNIGLRAFDEGAIITITVKNADGMTMASKSVVYEPNYFNQWPAVDFLGIEPSPGDSIYIFVEAGRTILYGSTNDNISNDGSFQLLHKLDLDMGEM